MVIRMIISCVFYISYVVEVIKIVNFFRVFLMKKKIIIEDYIIWIVIIEIIVKFSYCNKYIFIYVRL